MKILITGGCGFIGSNLIKFIIRNRPQHKIINLDALTYSGNAENLANLVKVPKYKFVYGNINEYNLVKSIVGECDAIIHLAAESHVDRSIVDSRPFVETNVLGTQCLLDAWRSVKDNSCRFVYVSSDEVYGSLDLDNSFVKFNEQTPLNPRNPYAVTKAAGDMLARAYHNTYGMNICVTRCANNFGPYQFPEKAIPLFVTNLIEGKKIPLYGDGKNVRDWIYVDDHAEAILAVMEHGKAGETYNIGGNNERSNLQLVHEILNIMGKDESMVQMVPDRPGHDLRYASDISKIERELKWSPTRSQWPNALARTIKWYVDNQPWWQRIKSGEYRDYKPQG
jgi:dTDP-glucose 4,6-dehydratase